DWAALFRSEDRRFVCLPTYQWQQEPYWFEAPQKEPPLTGRIAPAARSVPKAPALRTHFLDRLRSVPSAQRPKLLLDHLQAIVGRILKVTDASAITPNSPLRQLGFALRLPAS